MARFARWGKVPAIRSGLERESLVRNMSVSKDWGSGQTGVVKSNVELIAIGGKALGVNGMLLYSI